MAGSEAEAWSAVNALYKAWKETDWPLTRTLDMLRARAGKVSLTNAELIEVVEDFLEETNDPCYKYKVAIRKHKSLMKGPYLGTVDEVHEELWAVLEDD